MSPCAGAVTENHGTIISFVADDILVIPKNPSPGLEVTY